MVRRVVSRGAQAGRDPRSAHRALTAKVRIAVADAAGNQTIAGRSVRLSG
jgi:hypothetical protein